VNVILEIKASGMCGSDLHNYHAPAHAPGTVTGGMDHRSIPGGSDGSDAGFWRSAGTGFDQPLMNASKSALIVSACVVGMPWGRSL